MRKFFVSGVCVGIAAVFTVRVVGGQVPSPLANVHIGSPLRYTVHGVQKQLEVEARDIAAESEEARGQRCVVYRVGRYAVGMDPSSKTREATVWQWWQRYYADARPIPYFTAALAKDGRDGSFYVVVSNSISYYLIVEVYKLDLDADQDVEQPRFNGGTVEGPPNAEPMASNRIRFDPFEGGARTIDVEIEEGQIVLTAVRHDPKLPRYVIRYDMKSNEWIKRSTPEKRARSSE